MDKANHTNALNFQNAKLEFYREPGREEDEVKYLLMFPMIAMKLEDLTNDNHRSERMLTS